jgi:hypothetical protein
MLGPQWISYRLWSALFGVGSIVATFLLGRRLFGEHVGLLAAALLATSNFVLSDHGAMNGVMESAVVFCVLVSVLLVSSELPRRRPLVCIILVVLSCGLASLFKPLMGFLVYGITVFAAVPHRSYRRRHIMRVLFLSLPGVIVLSIAWPLIMWLGVGDPFFEAFFYNNLVQRFSGQGFVEHQASWYGHIVFLARSMGVFPIGLGAIVILFVLFCATRRSRLGIVSVPPLAGLAVLSLSPAKLEHYAYPLYPFIALAIAVVGAAALRLLPHRPFKLVFFAALAALAWYGIYQALVIDREQPWSRQRALGAEIARGDLPLIAIDVERVPPLDSPMPHGKLLEHALALNDWRLLWLVSEHYDSIASADPETVEALLEAYCPAVLIIGKPHSLTASLSAHSKTDRWKIVGFYQSQAISVVGINLDYKRTLTRCVAFKSRMWRTYPRRRIDFAQGGNGSSFLVSGWAKEEVGGVWSDGPVARIEIPLGELRSSRLLVEMTMGSFAPDGVRGQHVKLNVAGLKEEFYLTSDPKTYRFQIDNSATSDRSGALAIFFELPEAAAPASVSNSQDTRQLGVRLLSIDVKEIVPVAHLSR